MNEKWKFTPEKSAEKRFLMEEYEQYAQKFMHDPVSYMRELRLDLIEEDEGDTTSVAVELINEFHDLMVVASNLDITSDNEYIQRFLGANTEYDSMRAVFGLLKESGVTREELLSYVNIEMTDSTADEVLLRRGEHVVLNELYGTV